MILARLKEYADRRMDLPPEMYAEKRVRWFIELRQDGSLEGFTSRGGETKANRNGEPLEIPDVVRAAGIKPRLLADNGEYVLGVGRSGAKENKVAERHRQFRELVEACAERTGEESVEAVARFLEALDESLQTDSLPEGFDANDLLTFRVEGELPIDLESVQRFWAERTLGEENPIMTCLVTGEEAPVQDRMPVKIKGVPGGQTSGTSLVSANARPFTSYGLENSLTSPISRNAAERFGKALNHLLSDKSSRAYIGPTVYVFWTREETGFDFLQFVEQPGPEAVRRLFDAPYAGRETHGSHAEKFYALALSASGGRAVVRDWLETTIPEVEESLRRWFTGQEIVDHRGNPGSPLGLYALVASGYRDAQKEMTPATPATFMRVAIKGGRVPDDVLARVVRRNRAEGDVTRPRAALIKLFFATQETEGVFMERMKSLNTAPPLEREEDRAAYHCGRLLAELEAVQRAALGQVNATLTDRYYGSASSAPASVLGTLVGGAQSHLGKLRKNRPGVHAALQRRLEEIMSELPDFPRTLNMRQQGLFALGYYHQRAHERKSRENREES